MSVSRIVEESKKFIIRNIKKEDVIESAAKKFNMSYETFRKKFLWETGESPGQFCCRLKVQMAKSRLITTDSKMYTVARHCGWQSESAFAHAFRRAVGMTPIQYRKENAR